MSAPDYSDDQALREAAYFVWEREGRPDGRAQDHWLQAVASLTKATRPTAALMMKKRFSPGARMPTSPRC
ncbi:MAG: DUF2934 domain-containing protein [Rhodopila sp.]